MPTGRNSRLLCPTDRSSDATEAHTSHKANRRTVDSGSFRRSRMFFLRYHRLAKGSHTTHKFHPHAPYTEVKWKTDTVFIEKPVPTALTAKIITVRDTIVLPASHPKGQMWAALSTGQGTSSTETASIPLSDTALQDADTAARQQTMPHLADIQAEFQKQKRRMDEFSKQYEHIDPYYENLY